MLVLRPDLEVVVEDGQLPVEQEVGVRAVPLQLVQQAVERWTSFSRNVWNGFVPLAVPVGVGNHRDPSGRSHPARSYLHHVPSLLPYDSAVRQSLTTSRPRFGGRLSHWRDHLTAGDELVPAGLVSSGTLLRAWSERWQSEPRAPLWLGAEGSATLATGRHGPARRWWTAGEFDAATRRVAGRLQGAGLQPGDRVLWSRHSSVGAIVAHVGALRAGMVVVPANPAYSRRELVHIVSDVRPAAAIVERPDQAEWVRRRLGPLPS